MKKFLNLKSLLSLFVISLYLCVPAYGAKTTNQNAQESDSFNFIKSNEEPSTIIYDDRLLLYGGIALIFISISGMTFTLLPSKKKRNNSKK